MFCSDVLNIQLKKNLDLKKKQVLFQIKVSK